jgi:hypothetical protein
VHYQAFGLPTDTDQTSQTDDESKPSLSVFDAAKNAARGRNTLVTEVSVAFPLPKELASVQSNDGTSFETKKSATRLPLLAKFSESVNGVRFLALQYTPTMVRVVIVQTPESSRGSGDEKHWAIDLSYDIHPVATAPDKMPSFREGREINTAIIGGGVIWCRGTNHSLNLIVITTTAVIIYEMNVQTRTLAKSRVYPHQTATSFWFEATSRVLLIGCYRSNNLDGNCPEIVMEMKTLFFNQSGNVESLPTFVVGSLREKDPEEEGIDTIARSTKSKQSNVVSPTDISLICLHGDVFCVEMGSLGMLVHNTIEPFAKNMSSLPIICS